MSYSRSHKLTSNEKRLQALKLQLYGKDQEIKPQYKTSLNISSTPTEGIYFKKDLFKTLILATLIILVQLFLFSATSKGLINLSW